MKQTILITGSSGHAGREIAKRLLPDYEVIGMDLVKGPFTQVTGDISDWGLMKELTRKVDAVIHTASLHAPHVQQFSRKRFVEINIEGCLQLLEACKLNEVHKFIYTSTTSVYGESLVDEKKAVWVTESLTPRARDIYDITKLAAEELCHDFYRSENIRSVCLRVSRFWNEPLPAKIFYRMYRGLDVKDVAQAHQLALEDKEIGFGIFNISSQTIFENHEVAALKNNARELLENKMPDLVELFTENGWELPREIDRVYVIEKAKKMLGYRPQYNIDEMLKTFTK